MKTNCTSIYKLGTRLFFFLRDKKLFKLNTIYTRLITMLEFKKNKIINKLGY
jgi:hypothetical protein